MQSYIPMFLVLVIVFGVIELSRIHARLRASETKLTMLLMHLGLDPARRPEPSERVKELARLPGSKIEAIKAYREQTGADLKEAKAVVERLAANDPADR